MRLLLAFILLSVTTLWSQTNYYVDRTNGNDGNNGTSLATAWKSIQRAANSATPNSIVHIKSGVYSENVVVNISGTVGNPIVFTNYEGGDVILDGAGTTGTTMLSINNKSFITFENITIQNLTSTYAKGISLTSGNGTCKSITFRNITIRNIGWTNNITSLPIESDNAWAMYIRGQSGGITDLTIDGCRIHDNVIGYSEALTVGGNIDGFVVKNCTVYDNTNIGIHVSGNDSNGVGPKNGVIRENICYGNISPVALSAGIYMDGPDDIIIEKNTCYENPIGIEVGCEKDGTSQYITVRNNLIYNNYYTGLAVGGYTTETTGQVLYSTFRNNTFYKNNSFNTGLAEITVSKASNCIFEDNIIYANSENILLTMLDIQPQENNLLNYNCWYTQLGAINNFTIYWGLASYHSFNTYKNGTGQDANSFFTNPGFQSEFLSNPQFSLLSSSPCINHGNPVLAIGISETDFDGNPRIIGNVIDIGAKESILSLAVSDNEISMARIFPNPFKTQTTITAVTPLNDASFLVYDLSGRIMRQLDHLSGTEILFERENIVSGFYLYQIISNNKIIATGKLIAE